jgi:dTDP-glucose 4,6-dehydratase
MKKSKLVIYLTGCLGFIGSHVTRSILESGHYVIGIDKETYAANLDLLNEFNANKRFKYIKGDISLIKDIPDCDYVLNIAAESHVDNSIEDQDLFIESNIRGVYNLLTIIQKKSQFKRPALIHFSTDEVYGDIVEGAFDESSLLNPSNPYAATKAAADQLIFAWCRTFNIDSVILRPTNNYGTHQFQEKLIPKTLSLLKRDKKIPLHNKGTPVRTWLHVSDTANFVNIILEKNITKGVFNLGGNVKKQNIEVVSKIINSYLKKDLNEVELEEYFDLSFKRIGQDVRYSVSSKKANDLGWAAKADFDEKLIEIVEFYRDKEIF